MHDAINAVIDQHTNPVEFPAPTSYVGALDLAQDNSDFVDDFVTEEEFYIQYGQFYNFVGLTH